MPQRPRLAYFLWLVVLLALQACATEDHGSAANPKPGYLYGNVVGVMDGDTLTILSPTMQQAKIRLAEIDTPEGGQPFGTWAKQRLSEMVFRKPIAMRLVDIDRYDRIVGRIYVDGLEDDAREAQRGLWSQATAIPPWEWRRRQHRSAGARFLVPHTGQRGSRGDLFTSMERDST